MLRWGESEDWHGVRYGAAGVVAALSGSAPRYEVAEMVNVQALREAARDGGEGAAPVGPASGEGVAFAWNTATPRLPEPGGLTGLVLVARANAAPLHCAFPNR